MIYDLNLNNKNQLTKLGYNSNLYYCGNSNMEKIYSYIYNALRKTGVKFAMNRACFIHDLNYSKPFTLRKKLRIDNIFYKDMVDSVIYEYAQRNISLFYCLWLCIVSFIFYFIVTLFTPIYILKKN